VRRVGVLAHALLPPRPLRPASCTSLAAAPATPSPAAAKGARRRWRRGRLPGEGRTDAAPSSQPVWLSWPLPAPAWAGPTFHSSQVRVFQRGRPLRHAVAPGRHSGLAARGWGKAGPEVGQG
jgi:hypothetical protein